MEEEYGGKKCERTRREPCVYVRGRKGDAASVKRISMFPRTHEKSLQKMTSRKYEKTFYLLSLLADGAGLNGRYIKGTKKRYACRKCSSRSIQNKPETCFIIILFCEPSALPKCSKWNLLTRQWRVKEEKNWRVNAFPVYFTNKVFSGFHLDDLVYFGQRFHSETWRRWKRGEIDEMESREGVIKKHLS